MRWQRLRLAVFLTAAGIAGAWTLTGAQDAGQIVRLDAPASQSVPTTALSMEDMIRQAIDSLAGQALCEAPPVELTEEMKQAIEKTLSTLPMPPTVPSDTGGAVTNIHRRVVPC
jgi:hypothetical protein